ncbi:MAG: hypothetical protein A2Z51_03600 [Deltaproteobacteria bacterium RBG_19FT_COMBO_52_11]|nr:MAG: hypothetical protein A2Z51_03600 [Deltaproteobacteria bacterium RBG_19FT_COMBO_52_11]
MGRLGRKRNVRSPAPAQEKITPSFGEAVKKFKSAAKSAFLVVQGAEKFVRLRRTKIGGDRDDPQRIPCLPRRDAGNLEQNHVNV